MTMPAGPDPVLAALPPLAGEDHVCAECDIAFADVPVERALVVVAGIPAAAAAAVAEVPDAARGLRPAPGVWSVAAYACHLRDVYATYTIRLFRTRTERRPQLEPMLADLRAVRFGYDRCDVAAVLAQLAAHVEGFGQRRQTWVRRSGTGSRCGARTSGGRRAGWCGRRCTRACTTSATSAAWGSR